MGIMNFTYKTARKVMIYSFLLGTAGTIGYKLGNDDTKIEKNIKKEITLEKLTDRMYKYKNPIDGKYHVLDMEENKIKSYKEDKWKEKYQKIYGR